MYRLAFCNELFKGWDFKQVCDQLARCGYQGVEVAPFTLAESVEQLTAGDRKQLRQTALDAKLEIVAFHWLLVSPPGLHLTSPDAGVRKRTLDYLVALAQCCADLGGRIMVFGSPRQRSLLPGVTPEQAWRWAQETLSALADRSGSYGVIIALEPLAQSDNTFITSVDEGIRFVKEANNPYLQLLLDVKSMSGEGPESNIPRLIEAGAPYLVHFHANDANLAAPGFGQTDFVPIFDALRKTGYMGWVSSEPFVAEGDIGEIACRSYDYLRRAEQDKPK